MAKTDVPPTTPTDAVISIVGADMTREGDSDNDTALSISDEEIRERLSVFESEEFPSNDCIYFAEYLAKSCRGEVTEAAIRTLVENFPDDRLRELVRKHVAPTLSPDVDYCAGVRGSTVGYALTRLGFDVRNGWRVSWPGGEALEGENICRLGLLAVWLRGIQQPGGEGESPS